jgi:hypothetical protein
MKKEDPIFSGEQYAKAVERKDGVIDIKQLLRGRDKALLELYKAMIIFYELRRKKNRSKDKSKVTLTEDQFKKIQWCCEDARRHLGARPMIGFEALMALRDDGDAFDCFGS